VPFSFHVALPSEFVKEGAPTRINISKSIEEDVLSHISQAFTTEDVFVVQCSPQAVFRVRPATRCSSTLSGVFSSYSHLRRLTAGVKVMHHLFYVLLSPRRVTYLRPALATATHVYGTFSRSCRPMCSRVIPAGCSASSGKGKSVSLLRVGTTAKYVRLLHIFRHASVLIDLGQDMGSKSW
jgi:hypothetical protein